MSVERIQFQHSAQLMKSLTDAGVLYESVVYTDMRPDMQQSARRHLYASITEFLYDSCWPPAAAGSWQWCIFFPCFISLDENWSCSCQQANYRPWLCYSHRTL